MESSLLFSDPEQTDNESQGKYTFFEFKRDAIPMTDINPNDFIQRCLQKNEGIVTALQTHINNGVSPFQMPIMSILELLLEFQFIH